MEPNMPMHGHDGDCSCDRRKRFMKPLWNVFMLAAVIYVALLAWNAAKQHAYIGRPDSQRDTIVISGEGKVTALPDIATVSIGVQTESAVVSAAQKDNTTKMNAILDKVKSFGVKSEDIKTTNYTIYPLYDYVNGKQVSRGYQVSQSVDVKIRNLDTIGDVLAAVGGLGANQVSGVSFTIDEPETLRQEARLKALEAAKKKAQDLANAAGVKLGKVVGFSEDNGSVPGPIFYSKDVAAGMGGGGAAPSIESGSQDVIVDVSVVYEILP